MSQNSTGPRDHAMDHQPEHQDRPTTRQEQATDTPTRPMTLSSEPLMWRLATPGVATDLFPGRLCYKSTDPYAVHMAIRAHDDTMEWVFARTLLIGGLAEPTGMGDVEISPCSRDGVDIVQMTLQVGEAYAVLETPIMAIAEFLQRTCQAVPLGREHQHLDLDALVRRLLQDVR